MNLYKSLFFGLTGIVVTASAFGVGWWYGQDHRFPALSVTQTPSPTPALSGTIPEKVVSPSASPEALQAQPNPREQDAEKITQAMAARHGKSPAEVELTVSSNTGVHASGGVTFTGEMGGGWWLAAKENGSWIIVADGNGTIPCEAIEPYNFPVTMVPECYSETTGDVVKRL
jgi:hypothetical protein